MTAGRKIEKETPATLNGLTLAVARRLAQFVFGGYFVSLNQNYITYEVMIFDSYKGEPLEREILDDFIQYWGNCFNFTIVKPESYGK